jgi:DNA-binding MarR family transcriptional regulator
MFFLKELPTREILEAYGARYPEMDVPTVEAALTMLRSASVLLRRLEGYFAEHGLSQTRFLILILVDREPEKPGLTATELVKRLDVSRPVVSGTIKSLEREGLLAAVEHPADARSRLFRLSPEGRRRLDALLPGYYRIIQEHMAEGEGVD